MTNIVFSHFRKLHSSGSQYRTVDVNMPPTVVTAQASLHGTTGAGTQFTGIKRFVRSIPPSGTGQVVDLGEWPAWEPVIVELAVSVTFAIATGQDQLAWASIRIDELG